MQYTQKEKGDFYETVDIYFTWRMILLNQL